MRFTVLGSGTARPSDRGPAGFLVQHDGHSFLVDGGSGTLQRLWRAGVLPEQLAGGVYSHRHPDHCADLVPLLFAMHVPPGRPTDYPIWAGVGFASFFVALQGAYGSWIDPGTGRVVVHEIPLDRDADVALVGDLRLRTAPANHGAGALHLRFDAPGASVVFSGDTGPSEGLIRLARGAALLVCECAAPDHAPVEGHLTPSWIRDLVTRTQPGEVWLTHLYRSVDPDVAVETVAMAGRPVRRAADLDTWSSQDDG